MIADATAQPQTCIRQEDIWHERSTDGTTFVPCEEQEAERSGKAGCRTHDMQKTPDDVGGAHDSAAVGAARAVSRDQCRVRRHARTSSEWCMTHL